MGTTYQLTHVTRYRYAMPVAVSHHTAFVEPKNVIGQTCLDFRMDINPEPTNLHWRRDFFGNTWSMFTIMDSHTEMEVTTNSQVVVDKLAPELWTLPMTCEGVRAAVSRDPDRAHLAPYQFASPRTDSRSEIREFAAPFLQPDRPYAEAAFDLARHMKETFEFDADATDANTPVFEFFKTRKGVCQDFAHLMLACLRSWRLPARYVSGYILTHPPPGQPRLEGADASHAWVSIYLPEYGWLDIDPTNGILTSDEHIVVAWGRDYSDLVMVRGAVVGGGSQDLVVEVTMKPIEETHASDEASTVL